MNSPQKTTWCHQYFLKGLKTRTWCSLDSNVHVFLPISAAFLLYRGSLLLFRKHLYTIMFDGGRKNEPPQNPPLFLERLFRAEGNLQKSSYKESSSSPSFLHKTGYKFYSSFFSLFNFYFFISQL